MHFYPGDSEHKKTSNDALFSFLSDLRTMSERLKSKYYCSKKLFIADMQRIFSNCRAYNAADTEYVRYANTLEKFFMNKIKEYNLIDDD